MSVVKECGEVGGLFNLYLDDVCDRGTIVIYNYGRAFVHPDDEEAARREFSANGIRREVNNGLKRILHGPPETFQALFD
jgi:hypothetical protein